MKIRDVTWRHRRDFTAVFECEHCKAVEIRTGYDDRYFHEKVIPAMICQNCGRARDVLTVNDPGASETD